MAEVADTAGDVIDAFDGAETDDEAFFALLDFSAKEVAVAAAQRGGGSGGSFPARAYITGLEPGADNLNFDNRSTDGNQVTRFNDDSDGCWIEWITPLSAGEYTLDGHFVRFEGAGILVFSLSDDDGATRDNIDDPPYNGSGATVDLYHTEFDQNRLVSVATGITIATAGEYRLRATVTDNNAAATGFVCIIKSLVLAKTD